MNSAQTTMALKAALAKRYAASDWAFFPELRNGTGSSFTRSADGFAMSLYPSRGIEFHGFEIKANAGDLAAEIRHPEKADAVGRFVDRWWIVTTRHVWNKKGDDIPEAWGVMTLQDRGGLRIVRQAAAITSEPLSRALLASIVLRSRKATEEELETARRQSRADGLAAAQVSRGDNFEMNQLERRVAQLEKRIAEFEAASGIKIDVYGGDRLGNGLKRMLEREGSRARAKENVRQMISQLEAVIHA